jgi:hypothetical protein
LDINLNFKESVSRLHGKSFSAEAFLLGESIKFKIIPDLFCRDWSEVSYSFKEETTIIGRYLTDLDEAKTLCEKKYQELLKS